MEWRKMKDGSYEPIVVADKIKYNEKKLEISQWDELCIKRFAGVEPLGYTNLYKKDKDALYNWAWLESDSCSTCGWRCKFRSTTAKDVCLNRETHLETLDFDVTDINGKVVKHVHKIIRKPGIIERLGSLVAPYLVLDPYQQITGLLCATGAHEWKHYRGRINVLFDGPPGTVKTLLARWITRLRRTSRRSDATNLTGLSSTSMVLPDESGRRHLVVGPFVLSRYGVYHIDEYEKMAENERNKLLTASEEGVVYIDKYEKHRAIPAPSSLLATANPRNNKWQFEDKISSEEFGIPLQQVSRFDIILIFRDIIDKETDRSYAQEKSIREEREFKRSDDFIVSLLEKYIEYVRIHYSSLSIDSDAGKLLNEYWARIREQESAVILKRSLEGYKRIARCMARLSLQTHVTKDVAVQTMEYLNGVLMPLINSLQIVKTEEEELFEQTIEYIRVRKKNPVTVKSVVENLISKDKRLNDFIMGLDRQKIRPLEQAKNERYNKLCVAISEHPYIKVLRHRPLVVSWDVDKYQEDKRLREQQERQKQEQKLEQGNEKKEEGEQHEQEQKELSSSEIYQLSGNQNPLPHQKNEVQTPPLSVESTRTDNQVLEQYYGKQGGESSENDRGGHFEHPDSWYTVTEDSSKQTKSDIVIVKDKFATAVDMLHNSCISIDLEWNQSKKNRIFQAAFKDHTGKSWVLNLADKGFSQDEAVLIKAIITILKNYRMLLGYFSQGEKSDWEILDERCKAYGIESPINIYEPPQQDPDDEQRRFIGLKLEGNHGYDIIDVDVGLLHKKESIKSFFASQDILYSSADLDTVAKARLNGRGKFTAGGKITGANVAKQKPELQRAYGAADSELCYDLATANNSVLIASMEGIADKTKISFQTACNSGPSKWWSSYYENVMHVKPSPNRVKPEKGEQRKYRGGKILDHKRGEYFNVSVFDFNQLYPNVAIETNVSPETINCGHPECEVDPKAYIVTNDKKINDKKYYTCRKLKGSYPTAVASLIAERERYKQLEAQAKEEGNSEKAIEYGLLSGSTKIFSNSGYGLFGNSYFPYADIRTAEIITAVSRTKLAGLSALAETHGFKPIYGDTDSTFMEGGSMSKDKLETFERACKEELGVPAKYERTFTKLLLVSAKNYLGEYINKKGNKQTMTKGLVGKKSNTPPWARKVFDEVKQRWVNGEKETMLEVVVDGVSALKSDNVPKEDLLVSTKCGQDPFKGYKEKAQRNLPQKILGMKYSKREGEAVQYYLAENETSEFDGAAFTEMFENRSITKYLERLETAVLRVLHTAGFTVEDIYEVLELRVPPPAELRNKLWSKPHKKDSVDEEDEEVEEEEIEEEEKENGDE